MKPDFWKGKKVLITGHTGFQGSWLSLWLQRFGADLVGYSLAPPTQPNLYELASVEKGMESILGDIRDLDHFKYTLDEYQTEIVIHLAGQSLVSLSYQDPLETYSVNLMGTVTVLEGVRRCPSVGALLCVTSDKCYENQNVKRGYLESDPLGGRDPYSNSKAGAELTIKAFCESIFNDEGTATVASARVGNVLGGGDWGKDRLIPDILRSLEENNPIRLRNPMGIRPWQHVLEPLWGYLLLLEKMITMGKKFMGAWNFGSIPEEAMPVSQIAEKLLGFWGAEPHWETNRELNFNEDLTLKLDSKKANNLLGWCNKLSLDEAMKWIVEWYRVFQKNGDVKKITLDQIARYQNR